MRRFYSTSLKIASLLGVLFLVLYAVRSWREAQSIKALFAGPSQIVEIREMPLYARPVYDLEAYADYDGMTLPARRDDDPFAPQSAADDPEWIEGPAARKILEVAMRRAQEEREETASDAPLYLVSPSVYREKKPSPLLRISYPADGAVFPPNLCEPRVEWEDSRNDLWQVTVGLADTALQWSYISDARSWRFPPEVWGRIRKEGTERRAWIQIKGARRASKGPVQASRKVHFRISRWPADEVIVYRLVVPPFNKRKTPNTFSRAVGSFEVRPFLLARDNYCFNCHTFSSKSGTSGVFSVQARYMSPGSRLPVYLGIYDIDRQAGWKVKLPFDIQMSTFMSWSPDGRFLAFSANQQLVTFAPTVYETQFAGEPTSDLALYDVLLNSASLLPGAAEPERLEILPRWSLDGRRLVYCSAPVGLHPARTRYDLLEIPFDEGKGGTPRPVPGASQNGRSNYFPRFSPDGKWLSFCQADAGILIKSSSDIYLLPADLEGEPRRLESNVPSAADSWHSWSSNGHWLVFASKRDDGIYARLYLTEIDAEGRASPAVRLPLREEPLASFNIPEFVAQWPQIDESELFEAVRVEAAPRTVEALAEEF